MTRARVHLEPGYVLNAKPYSDTSLLLEVFTREHGRVGLIARGARGAKSKTRALLQALQPLLLSWSESGELGTLTAVESQGMPLPLLGERVFYGWYVNELVLKLLERRDPHPQIYQAYADALPQLAGEKAEAVLRIFEKRLLAGTGYGLHLPDDLHPQQHYRMDAELGPLPAAAGPTTVAGDSLLALAQEHLETPQALADARKILHAALKRQLGGKELNTPRMLRELRARQEN